METPVTAERVFDRHAAALDLPKRNKGETLDDYTARVGATKEAKRCLTEAAAAAALADHVSVAHWLNQARQHVAAAA